MTTQNLGALTVAPSPPTLIDYRGLPEIPCPLCGAPEYEAVTVRFDGGRIVRCMRCGHKYLNPTLTEDILDVIYAGYHESESDESVVEMVSGWFAVPDGPYQQALRLLEECGGLAGKSVVEVGCGPGRFLHECQRRGAIVTGVDISPGAVRMADNFFGIDLIQKTVQQAIHDGDLKPGGGDFVFAFEIIEHVHKPQEFLQSLYELLSPGGRLFISTPNFHLFKLMGHAAAAVTQWPEHLHFFEPDTFRHCLTQSGFTDIHIISVTQQSSGQRQKQILARKALVKAVWQRMRKLRAVYILKDVLFKLMDKREERASKESWNGVSLLGCARKPGGGSSA